jgi:hypothetical protein
MLRSQAMDAFQVVVAVIIAALILAIFLTLGSRIQARFSRSIIYPNLVSRWH